MLGPVEFKVRGDWWRFDTSIRGTYPNTQALAFWTAYLARDLLRLGVYFRALTIMLQIPGAADYRYLCHEDMEKDSPPSADDPYGWIHGADRRTVFSVLAECLCELDAEDILKQIPEAKHTRLKKLSAKWQKYLNRESTYECGLLNVVAECLDELIIKPGLEEIDAASQGTWWHDYWSRIDDEK